MGSDQATDRRATLTADRAGAAGPLGAPAEIRRNRNTVLRRFLRNRRAVIGAVIIVIFAVLALLAPLIAPYPPEVQQLSQRLRPPSPAHLMGTDQFGRDILSRALWAGRISLPIGVASVLISVIISVLVGAVAGFYGGVVGGALMRFTDIMLAFPTFFLLIAVVAAFGNDVGILIAVIGFTSWPVGARVVRGEVLALREREFVQAAHALGATNARLILRHIVPNVVPVIIVSATIRVPLAILLEAGLSYLGLGVQPPLASWGSMVADAKAVFRVAWWVAAFPGLFIFLVVMAFNLLGDGLRDAVDPRMQT
jgi:peptide/nickel transport system permease protein